MADLAVRPKEDIQDAAADVLAAIVLPERVRIARAGTACAFRLRAGRMLCLDKLGPVAHPRPLGHPRAMGIDVRTAPLVAGDALVLSTAGLISAVAEAEIAAILGAHTDVNAAVGALLSIAWDLGWPCFAVVAARVGAE